MISVMFPQASKLWMKGVEMGWYHFKVFSFEFYGYKFLPSCHAAMCNQKKNMAMHVGEVSLHLCFLLMMCLVEKPMPYKTSLRRNCHHMSEGIARWLRASIHMHFAVIRATIFAWEGLGSNGEAMKCEDICWLFPINSFFLLLVVFIILLCSLQLSIIRL